MLDPINNVALAIGYAILWLIGIVVVVTIIGLWKGRLNGTIQIDTQIQTEGGEAAWFADMVIEGVEEVSSDARLRHEPPPVAHLDWSLNDPQSTDLNRIKDALSDAGFTIHPLPQEREQAWSDEHAGVWAQEPTWYVEDETGRTEVTADTSEPAVDDGGE